MQPAAWRSITREQDCASSRAEVRLVSTMSITSSARISGSTASVAMPVLLTSTSIRPNRLAVSLTKTRTASWSRPSMADQWNHSAPSSCSMNAVLLRLKLAMLQPWARNPATSSAPRPRLPPLISTVLGVACVLMARRRGIS